MKKLVTTLITIGLISTAGAASATDLMDVFHQAQSSDPTYQEAKAKYLSVETTVGQARGALLPNLSLTGSYNNQSTNTKNSVTGTDKNNPLETKFTAKSNVAQGTLSLDQPLFNWASFAGYAQVKLNVKQAASTYAAAEQSLITRTAKAYFSVLTAEDVLRYTAAQKRQLFRSLEVAKQRYHVGLDAITSVYDAQAKYDGTKATYIANENDTANKKEALREITGQIYPSLAKLRERIPLMRPAPANIDEWTQTAENQNLSLLAARFAAQAAEENIKVTFAGHLPTLDLQGSYSDTNTEPLSGVDPDRTDVATGTVGVALSVPIFAGGQVHYKVKQAEYDYQTAVAEMDVTHRATVAAARQSYLGVLAEISQIKADRQAIKSSKAALASNEAAYKVGTRTIVDVLTAQSTLFNAETKYAQDRFEYVNNFLALKEAAGTLNMNDVIEINSWLTDAKTAPVRKAKKVAQHKKAVQHHVKKSHKKAAAKSKKV